ncbi:MAG: YCF48-related protein, partial [Bacteroidota bacterium]
TSFSVSGLDYNTKYYWRVNSEYAEGTGAWSVVWNFTTSSCTVPTLISPENRSTEIPTSPELRWDPTDHALSYNLQVSTSSDFNISSIVMEQTGIDGTSFSVIGLDYDTKYYWRVNAEYPGGTGGWSDTWNFTTESASVPALIWPPDDATGVSTSPTLQWKGVEGATSYHLQVDRHSIFSSMSLVVDQSGITGTSFDVSGLEDGSEYYWRVNAESAGVTSDWSRAWSFTTIPALPEAPYLNSPWDGDLQTVSPTFTWSYISGAETYQLQVSTDSSFLTLVFDDAAITETQYTAGPFDYFTSYYWRVCAKNAGGTSAFSEKRSFQTETEAWRLQGNTFGWFSSVCFLDAENGWIAGWSGDILKTTDGGTTWNELTSGTTESLKDVFFTDSYTGWIVGESGLILKTTDGGTSWNELASGATEDLEAVHFVDDQNGWAAGDNKIILHTTDGGASWTTQLKETNRFLKDIYFLDSQVGWAVGMEILQTTDGGATWSSLWNDQVIMASHFLDDLHGWVVGWDGAIFGTADGGKSWNPRTSGVPEDLQDVCFVNNLVGWAVGREGIILKTTDGGSTWSLSESGTKEDLFSLCFIDENTGWVVGANKIILKTTTGGGTGLVDDMKNLSPEIEEPFNLEQNYPNPFHSNTTIRFTVSTSSHVTMKVLDFTGREIERLADHSLEPGMHEITWDAEGFSSGIYICFMQAGEFRQTRKMILIK